MMKFDALHRSFDYLKDETEIFEWWGQFETGNQEVKLGEFKFEWIWRAHICR